MLKYKRSHGSSLKPRLVWSPLLDGQLGVVRIGLWAGSKTTVRSMLRSIIGFIPACLAVSAALSIMLADKLIRPILDLKAIADEISRGRLDTPSRFKAMTRLANWAARSKECEPASRPR